MASGTAKLATVALMGFCLAGCATVYTNQKVEVVARQTGGGQVTGMIFLDDMLYWGPAAVPDGDGAAVALHQPQGSPQLPTGVHTIKFIFVPDKDKPGIAQLTLQADGTAVGKPHDTVGAAGGQLVEGKIDFELKAPR